MEAGPHITQALATSKLACTIDLIVHSDMVATAVGGLSQRQRRVAEIIAIVPGERETGYATSRIFAPDRDGTAEPAVLPDEYQALASHGFDLPSYAAQQTVRS